MCRPTRKVVDIDTALQHEQQETEGDSKQQLQELDDIIYLGAGVVASRLHERTKMVAALPRRKKQQRLRFAMYDAIYEVPNIDDLPNSLLWMSSDELKEIRERNKIHVSIIENHSGNPYMIEASSSSQGGGGGRHHLCIRGLDQNTPSYYEKRYKLQKVMYHVVSHIQSSFLKCSKQQRNIDLESTFLAKQCSKYSAESVSEAILYAKFDRREACSVYYYLSE